MISEYEKSLITGYKKDFLARTGKSIKIHPCTKWEHLAYFTENIDFEKLVTLVVDFTGWDRDRLYGKRNRSEESVFRRAIIDFIAIMNGATFLGIGKMTGRDHTTIMNSIRFLELRLETHQYYKTALREIVQHVIEYYGEVQLEPKLRAV
jgi:chromosomal replication initiation ATPase DnaA